MLQRKKVLIVDDDSESRQLVVKVLKKLDFIDLFEAENGEEAIKIAHNVYPNLILMDILMPKMNGYEACLKIKSNPVLQSAIVIFMTAVSVAAINEKIIHAQGDDILRKPVDAGELYFRVKNYLMLTAGKANITPVETKLPSGPCMHQKQSIDLGKGFFYQVDAKVLCQNNEYIPLMKQEILLLEALIRQKNKVVAYDEILNIISKNEESTVANIRTLVKLIRRKTYKELIKTLPSIGYQIIL